MNRKRLVPILVLSGALAGCAAMQERPLASTEDAQSLGLPAEGMAGQERQEWAVKPPISPHWWRALGDVKLDALVDRALAHSPDLAMAQARLRQAEASVALADSQRGPTLGVGGSGAFIHRRGIHEKEKSPAVAQLENRYFGDNGLSIEYASLQLQGQWSPDLFGKYREQVAAARGQRQAVAYEIAQTRLVLAQGVATYYRQWQLLVQQKAIVQQRQQLNQVRERVVKELIRAEQVPPSQLYAVLQGNLRFATALSDLDGKVAQVRHGLAALTG